MPEPFLFGGIVDVVLDDAGDPADDLHLRLAAEKNLFGQDGLDAPWRALRVVAPFHAGAIP
ncbi:MAG TPA: hypothetical protein VM822_09215, partial [Pseudolabrys sp.]|nr:hypothetical protein [Pseudolabrys sp.]